MLMELKGYARIATKTSTVVHAEEAAIIALAKHRKQTLNVRLRAGLSGGIQNIANAYSTDAQKRVLKVAVTIKRLVEKSHKHGLLRERRLNQPCSAKSRRKLLPANGRSTLIAALFAKKRRVRIRRMVFARHVISGNTGAGVGKTKKLLRVA
jgi:hypothetical protein